jgi:hypothetical protein
LTHTAHLQVINPIKHLLAALDLPKAFAQGPKLDVDQHTTAVVGECDRWTRLAASHTSHPVAAQH